MIIAADDGNHKTLLQEVEGKFADMEHRMKSKKESSGSKDLDPLLDPLDNWDRQGLAILEIQIAELNRNTMEDY